MKKTILVISALLMMVSSSNVMAEMTAAIFYCDIPAGLGNSCAPDRIPFADGANAWCVFWDRTANGVDASDELVCVGSESNCANFSCQPFNGEIACGYAGNFATDPNFVIVNPPSAPDQPVYFLRVSGPNYCWSTDTFRLAEGYQELYLTEDSWTCETSSCAIGAVPNPVTGIEVTSDEYCLSVNYTFEHDGENVSGFNVYVRTSDAEEWQYRRQLGPTERGSGEEVCADGPVQVGIEAVNADQISARAFGVGRTFLRHFDIAGEIEFLGGRDIRLHVVHPPFGQRCGAYVWFDFYSGGNFVERILSDTNIDHAFNLAFECQMPASVPNPSCYIVMLDSSAHVELNSCGMSDTTFLTVDADDQPVVAREFALAQNYPNPFNPTTSIEFNVPNDGQVELAVFNLNGQKVATLFSGMTTAGAHHANWNGSSAASGMYFYRLQMGNQVLTRKMLLMK